MRKIISSGIAAIFFCALSISVSAGPPPVPPSVPPNGTNVVKGIVRCDGTTMNCVNGVASAVASGAPILFTGSATNISNAYSLTTTPSGFTFTAGYVVQFTASVTNTGSATLAVDGTTAEPIKTQTGGGSGATFNALSGGEIASGAQYFAVANTTCTCYVLTNAAGSAVAVKSLSYSLTATDWANPAWLIASGASVTITVPVSTSIPVNGGVTVFAQGGPVIIQANAADVVCASVVCSSAGGAATIPAGGLAFLSTNGAGSIYAAITQTGTVTGPGSSTNGDFAKFNGTSGNAIADSGVQGPTSGTLLGSVSAPATNPATGTPSSSTFLRGDGTWATPSGSGNVSGPGSSTNGYFPTWNGTSGTTLNGGIPGPASGTLIGSATAPASNPVTGTPSSSTYLRGDGTWSAVSAGPAFQPGYVSGNFYTTPFSGNIANTTLVANRLYAMPFYSPTAQTFTKISIYIDTLAASSACELGIYNNSNGLPSSLIIDAGNVPVTATGSQELTGLTLNAPSGFSWLVIGCNGAPTIDGFGSPGIIAFVTGWNSNHGGNVIQLYGAWTYAVGGLPATFPAVTNTYANMPAIFVRL